MKPITLAVCLALAAAAIGYRIRTRWGDIQAPSAQGTSLSVLIDNSASQTVDCAEITELVRAGLGGIEVGKSSHLTLYTLGSQETSYEPIPRLNIRLERGPSGIRKATRKTTSACTGIPTVSGSSIFRAVQVALDQLQSGGGKGSRLWVRTDLDENVDRRLFAKHGKAAILNNVGIPVVFCGIASTAQGGGPRGAQADGMVKTWRAAFIAPDLVQMQPFCPGIARRAGR